MHVVVDGEPLAVRLVRGGFAYPTVRCYGDGGFPALAARVQGAPAALREALGVAAQAQGPNRASLLSHPAGLTRTPARSRRNIETGSSD